MDKIVIVEHSEKNRGRAEDYAYELFKNEIMFGETEIVWFKFDPNRSHDYPGQLADCCGKGGTLVVATIFELIWPKYPDFNQLYDVLRGLHDRGVEVYSSDERFYEWESCATAIRMLQLKESWEEYRKGEC